MREIEICDVTLKELDSLKKLPHTFRQRIEIAKLLDRLGLSVIEATGIEDVKPDSLRIKSIVSSLKNSILAASEASGSCRPVTCKDGICIPSEAAQDA